MTWAWLLLPICGLALVGYGGRGLWADLPPEARRFAAQFSALMLGALLTGASLVVLAAWWAGRL